MLIDGISDASGAGCIRSRHAPERNRPTIRRYLVDIDEYGLGAWVTLWGEIVLTPEGRAQRKVLEREFAAAPDVVEARQLVGRADYLLKVVSREAGAWPALLQRIDADARFIATSTVQIEAGVAKRFGGLPQLETGQ